MNYDIERELFERRIAQEADREIGAGRAPSVAEAVKVADILAVTKEMQAVATGDYDGYQETLDPWTSENRADIDGWQVRIMSALSTPPQPEAQGDNGGDVLDEPARVGVVTFRKGVSISTVVEAAKRNYKQHAHLGWV